MKTTIISVIFLLLLVASTGKAQEQAQSKFEVYSVSFTAGWYQPSMDYWNDTYLPAMEVTDEFGGDIALGGEITFALPYNLRARGGVSYWKQKVEGEAGSAISSLQIGLTRFRLGALYAPVAVSFNGFQPYVGVEGQFYLIKNKLNDRTATTEQQGQDYSFAPVIGIDRSFDHVILGVEFMYNIGNYTQDVSDGIGVAEQKVSIDGPEVGISVGYKF